MSVNIDDFDISSKISDDLKTRIQLFHVFDDTIGTNILFVTSEDSVYGFGSNDSGTCGQGYEERPVWEPLPLPELSRRGIRQFFCGQNFVVALSYAADHQVYSWGHNFDGQLGRGSVVEECLKPARIDFFTDEGVRVTQISCGFEHCMALTTTGHVYAWGANSDGQVGAGDSDVQIFPTPIRIRFKDNETKIKEIYSFKKSSFALTIDGQVYSWGENEDTLHLGHKTLVNINRPKLIKHLINVRSIGTSGVNTYFLTNDGELYFSGRFKKGFVKRPKPMENCPPHRFIALQHCYSYCNQESLVMALTSDGVYKIVVPNDITKTNSTNLSSYCALIHDITYKTVLINPNFNAIRVSIDNGINNNSVVNHSSHPLVNNNQNDSYYRSNFKELVRLGSGGFGTVFLVKRLLDKKVFAIKRIDFQNSNSESAPEYHNYTKNVCQEVSQLSKLRSHCLVYYFNQWQEENYLYIQMEFVRYNLQNIIQKKGQVFDRQLGQPLEPIEYYMCCELFKEIVECVEYLHKLKPTPIIHRHLKPQNVLISFRPINDRFVKLCDFGMSSVHKLMLSNMNKDCMPTGWGPLQYQAPELFQDSDYNHKIDIFSLGLIGLKLLNIDLNVTIENIYPKNSGYLATPLHQLYQLLASMTSSPVWDTRPECSDILNKYNEWSLSKSTIVSQIFSGNDLKANITKLQSNDNSFFYDYLNYKFMPYLTT
ncbi:uncharacterized protein LOC128964011 [Oppia nitens]|uniref:uncharacterized protein LOC128964011 n=1 Tax=Oppia nitens TaxID=1686743 RepID=UPI0023DA2512|nr:uncharacterized protein LOC128964011 [Oppia nitens]